MTKENEIQIITTEIKKKLGGSDQKIYTTVGFTFLEPLEPCMHGDILVPRKIPGTNSGDQF